MMICVETIFKYSHISHFAQHSLRKYTICPKLSDDQPTSFVNLSTDLFFSQRAWTSIYQNNISAEETLLILNCQNICDKLVSMTFHILCCVTKHKATAIFSAQNGLGQTSWVLSMSVRPAPVPCLLLCACSCWSVSPLFPPSTHFVRLESRPYTIVAKDIQILVWK